MPNVAPLLTTLEEHFGYISDTKRLELFHRALRRVVRRGELVADVGCGVGILGLLCLQSGAAHVWGIDNTDAIEIARETMVRNGLGDRYTCLRERSFMVSLPEPVDVIVCDHVGYFGIDYGIIGMLADARRRMLKSGGQIMPRKISLVLAGVASAEGRAKAEAWTAASMPAEYHWLRSYSVNTKHACQFASKDIATEPVALGAVDLTRDGPDLLSFEASLRATHDGQLDGLAGWFECELADDVWMTNSPLAPDRIDRPQAFLAFDTPVNVAYGDMIEAAVSIRHEEGVITWSVRNRRTGQKQKQSTWNSRILSPADLSLGSAQVLQLSAEGLARKVLYGYVDGVRTVKEIEAAVLRDHPSLFQSPEEIIRFVRRELARSAR